MNYELCVRGRKVTPLTKARSLLDYQLLRQKLGKSQQGQRPTFSFDFKLDEPPRNLRSTRSKRQISTSQSKRANYKSNSNQQQFLMFDLENELNQHKTIVIRSNKTTLNFPFNFNYILNDLKEKKIVQELAFTTEFVPKCDSGFKNRVYKPKRDYSRSYYL